MNSSPSEEAAGLRILLIEDSPVSTEIVRAYLLSPASGGMHLEAVESLGEGLARLEQTKIDLVLLDLVLPDSRGYETFERFHRKAPTVPVIVLTGMDDDRVAENAVRAGAQDYLFKDELTPAALLRSIRYAHERSRAAARLEESERRLRAVVEDQTELICRFEPDGALTFVNPAFCRFFGRSEVELQAWNFFDLFPEDDRLEIATHLASLEPKKNIQTREQAFQGREQVRWILWTDRALFDAKGRLDGYQCVGHDDTGRRDLEGQLHHAQRMEIVGQLVSGIAHDFNNILTAISGYGDLLLHRLEEAGLGGREVAGFEKAVQRAVSLTGRLLAFSRSQVHRPEPVELRGLVYGVNAMLRQLISEQIEFELDLAEENLWVEADPGMLEQVIVNLVVNARDAMPLGGRLLLSTRFEAVTAENPEIGLRVGEYAVLVIRDDGSGMDLETQKRIFEPFFTTKEEGRGTGLGLATVARIVSDCQGCIQVESTVGEGATFTVHLPRIEEPTLTMTMEPRRKSRMPRSTGAVLVVEDDDSVRRFLELILRRHGYVARSARTAEEALRLLEGGFGPDALLTDLGLPGEGGLELARHLRDEGICRRALLISGYAGEAQSEKARSEGFPLLPKPFTSERLLRKLRRILGDAQGPGAGVQ